MIKVNKSMKDYMVSLFILALILLFGIVVGLADTSENDFKYVFSLVFGLILTIRFKQIGTFTYMKGKNIPSLLPGNGDLFMTQILTLIVGLVFLLISIPKLLPLLFN